MKALIAILLGLICFSQGAYASPEAAAELHQEINAYETEYYFLDFQQFSGQQPQQVCKITDFVPNTPDQIVADYARNANLVIGELVASSTILEIEAEEFRKKISAVQKNLEQWMTGKKVSRCSLFTIPPYSDGVEEHYIMVDGQLSFMFALSRAD